MKWLPFAKTLFNESVIKLSEFIALAIVAMALIRMKYYQAMNLKRNRGKSELSVWMEQKHTDGDVQSDLSTILINLNFRRMSTCVLKLEF